MSWLSKLFAVEPKGPKFRSVDWLEIEGKLRTIDELAKRTDAMAAKDIILQGDMLLDSIMKQAGVAGSTFGERLKNIKEIMPRSGYQQAWPLHLKRNELVHETGSFVAEWEKNTHLNNLKGAISAMRSMK